MNPPEIRTIYIADWLDTVVRSEGMFDAGATPADISAYYNTWADKKGQDFYIGETLTESDVERGILELGTRQVISGRPVS